MMRLLLRKDLSKEYYALLNVITSYDGWLLIVKGCPSRCRSLRRRASAQWVRRGLGCTCRRESTAPWTALPPGGLAVLKLIYWAARDPAGVVRSSASVARSQACALPRNWPRRAGISLGDR
jgi:hypothetical protein